MRTFLESAKQFAKWWCQRSFVECLGLLDDQKIGRQANFLTLKNVRLNSVHSSRLCVWTCTFRLILSSRQLLGCKTEAAQVFNYQFSKRNVHCELNAYVLESAKQFAKWWCQRSFVECLGLLDDQKIGRQANFDSKNVRLNSIHSSRVVRVNVYV